MKADNYPLPQQFLHRLNKIYPADFERICRTFLHKKQAAFRINYLKTDLKLLKSQLYEEKVRFKEIPFPQGAFILKSPLRCLQESQPYKKGEVFVQNISSMIPVIALAPENKDKVLDLCASPGAKTTQILSLAPQAQITAVEKSRKRYYKLLANLKEQGAAGVNVLLCDGFSIRKRFPEYFDKILVDAPCSAEGRFFTQNPRTYNYWKPKKIKEMVSTQKKLLYAAFFALKDGGELVYSTCTFAPEENEAVIDWFINKFPANLDVLPLDIPLENTMSGLKGWKGKGFSKFCRMGKRILPDEVLEGFFVIKLKKK